MEEMDVCSFAESMEVEEKRKTLLHIQKQVSKNKKQKYSNNSNFKDLNISPQLSEWLAWPPAQLQEWILVPCPRGLRCLVVAQNARTAVYSKTGRRVCSFKSQLPGDVKPHNTLTVLDCIYECQLDVFYVLDALYFDKITLLTCSADFRSFWLNAQFQKCVELNEVNEFNEKPFHLVPHYDCQDEEQLKAAFMTFPHFPHNNPVLDGYLFYHKDAYYTCGTTPLVGWLYAFMVPDVLGYDINKAYPPPDDYKTPMQYIGEFDAKLATKCLGKIKRSQLAIEEELSEENFFMESEELQINPIRRKRLHENSDDELNMNNDID